MELLGRSFNGVVCGSVIISILVNHISLKSSAIRFPYRMFEAVPCIRFLMVNGGVVRLWLVERLCFKFLRPLLDITRTQTIQYLDSHSSRSSISTSVGPLSLFLIILPIIDLAAIVRCERLRHLDQIVTDLCIPASTSLQTKFPDR